MNIKKTIIKGLELILRVIASSVVKKYKPLVIGITGSYGKSSAKEAIYAVVSKFTYARETFGNFNNELGFPLTIIGDYAKIEGVTFWLKVIFQGLKLLVTKCRYPKILVLEYAADKPGDLDYLIRIARPDVAIVTGISDIPVHVQFYASKEEVVKEKSKLVQALSKDGVAILNADDKDVALMKNHHSGKTIFFGYNESSNIKLSDFENEVSPKGDPLGIAFKIMVDNKILPMKILKTLGRAQSVASGAAVAVASILELDLFKSRDILLEFNPLPGRARIIKGVRGSWLIDDTYNASPTAMMSALTALSETKAKRRVAVLGHMAELGDFSDEAHFKAGELAAKVSDLLFVVGDKASKMIEGAISAGMSENKIRKMPDSVTAKTSVVSALQPGDLVLIKGSQSARMERIVVASMAEPEQAKELTVRQYGKWLKN